MRAAFAMMLSLTVAFAGCSSGALTPFRTDSQSVTFSVNPYVRITRQLVLVAADGAVVSTGVVSGRTVRFRLPTTEQALPYTGQCMQVRTRTGEEIGVAGVDEYGFVLPVWQTAMRSQYEGRNLQQQRARLTQQLNYNSQMYQKALAWMQNNPGMYVNGVCQTPTQTAQPDDACDNPEAGQRIAERQCSEELHCPAAGLAAGIPAGDYRKLAEFLTENGCALDKMSERGEQPTIEFAGQILGKAIAEEFLESLLKSAGAGEDEAHYGAKVLVIWGEYSSCVAHETSACDAKYQSWLNAPERAHQSCTASAGILQDAPQKIGQERALLQGIDNQIATLRAQTSYQSGDGSADVVSCRK
jgi:hypothetical protein